ncbi:MAG: GIY-YIG nuclease family protein [Halanaerobium sp.]
MSKYPDSGIYILKIKLEKEKEIKIGALGKNTFVPGYYFYVGTAQRNLKARINRHYSSHKKFHWHIDYLLAEAELTDDFNFELPAAGECFLAHTLIKEGGQAPVAGFGSSDCSCGSHLIYFPLEKGKKIVEDLIDNRELRAEFSDCKE